MSNILNNNSKPFFCKKNCWQWGTISAHFLKLIIRNSKVNELWLNVICQVINLKSNVQNASLSSRALLTKLETCFSGQTHTLPQLMCCKVHSGYINSLATPHTSHGGNRRPVHLSERRMSGPFLLLMLDSVTRGSVTYISASFKNVTYLRQDALVRLSNYSLFPSLSLSSFLPPALSPLWFSPVCYEFDVMSGRRLHKFIFHHHKLAECLCRS